LNAEESGSYADPVALFFVLLRESPLAEAGSEFFKNEERDHRREIWGLYLLDTGTGCDVSQCIGLQQAFDCRQVTGCFSSPLPPDEF
jgi:hypothetical protein